jgi:hypothetical protein
MNTSQAAPPAFFSYAREDSDFALRLAGDLKTAGALVWLDQIDIQPGQRWDRAVEEALTQCVRMLVVLTPAAVNSTNVMDEVSFALEERKTIIPIVYRDCTIPFRLRRLQHVDFRQDYARALNDLVRTLVSGTESVPVRPAVPVSSGDPIEVAHTQQQRALEQTVTDRDTRASEQAEYEARQRQLEQERDQKERIQAADKERLLHEQRLAAEQMQRDNYQRRRTEHERLEQERFEQEPRIATEKPQRERDRERQTEESRGQDKRGQAAEQPRHHELEAAAEQTERDGGARVQFEHRLQTEEQARAPNEQPRQEFGLAAVGVGDQPRERHSFDLAALWPLVDRFGGLCWLVVALVLPALLGFSLLDALAISAWYTKILGIACPAIAATVPAIPLRRVAIKYMTATFSTVSLLMPIFGLSAMRAGIEATGGVGISAIAAGFAEILLTFPFLVAALFAFGATTLPTVPVSLHARTRVVLVAGSVVVVLIVAKNISAFASIAATGTAKELPWLGAWLIRLAIPSGVSGLR